MKNKDIISKLDLEDYINSFKKLFARDKDITLQGDINLHYRLINQLSTYDLTPPEKNKQTKTKN